MPKISNAQRCNSARTTSSQRLYGVHTTFAQRPYSIKDARTAHKKLLQRAHRAHIHVQRAHCVYFFLFLYFVHQFFCEHIKALQCCYSIPIVRSLTCGANTNPRRCLCACWAWSARYVAFGDGTALTANLRNCWRLYSAYLGYLPYLGWCGRCKDATMVWQGFSIT